MKKWTVVIELKMLENSVVTQQEIERAIENCFELDMPNGISWRIMETIDAPYGPQGVMVKEFQPCICAKDFPRNPLCKAKVHVK